MTSGLALALLLALAQFAQSSTGELHLTVADPSGLALPGRVELVSEANQLRENLDTDAQGVLIVKRLPFGTYRIAVSRDGFAPFAGLVEVRSALPTEYRVAMSLAPLLAQVTVTPEQTLLDPHQTVTVNRIGGDTIQQRVTALPGRSLPDLVNTQPGWLLEANGDPASPRLGVSNAVRRRWPSPDRQPISSLCAGDRRRGGAGDERPDGRLSRPSTGGSSAASSRWSRQDRRVKASTGPCRRRRAVSARRTGTSAVRTAGHHSIFRMSGGLSATDRYLDPPVEENFTNRGTTRTSPRTLSTT